MLLATFLQNEELCVTYPLCCRNPVPNLSKALSADYTSFLNTLRSKSELCVGSHFMLHGLTPSVTRGQLSTFLLIILTNVFIPHSHANELKTRSVNVPSLVNVCNVHAAINNASEALFKIENDDYLAEIRDILTGDSNSEFSNSDLDDPVFHISEINDAVSHG